MRGLVISVPPWAVFTDNLYGKARFPGTIYYYDASWAFFSRAKFVFYTIRFWLALAICEAKLSANSGKFA
jgi:hypothetical protein